MTPKSYTLSADGNGRIESVMHRDVLAQIPNRVGLMAEADVVLVPISYYGDYKFHEALLSIDKPVILLDYLEWFGFATSHLLGKEELPRNVADNPEWQKLNRWAAEANIILTFQRELLKRDVGERRIPIEWPAYLNTWEREGKTAFDKRPFEVCYTWGYSNPVRPLLQSQIYAMMAEGKIDVLSHLDDVPHKIHEEGRKWIACHVPHTRRVDVNQIALRQAQSKIVVSLPGSGTKCFRSTEVHHSVPAIVKDEMAWSYDWINGFNCIKLPPMEFPFPDFTIAKCLNMELERENPALHSVYLEAQETLDKYHVSNYTRNYVMPAIERAL